MVEQAGIGWLSAAKGVKEVADLAFNFYRYYRDYQTHKGQLLRRRFLNQMRTAGPLRPGIVQCLVQLGKTYPDRLEFILDTYEEYFEEQPGTVRPIRMGDLLRFEDCERWHAITYERDMPGFLERFRKAKLAGDPLPQY